MTQIRMPCLQNKKIRNILSHICEKESIPLQEEELEWIVHQSDRDIRRAVLILQMSFFTGTFVQVKDYKTQMMDKLITCIVSFDKLTILPNIRKIVVTMIEKHMDMENFFHTLLNSLLECKDICKDHKLKIIPIITKNEHAFVTGYRDILHLENCIYSLINLLHNTL
jgi:DNA polymerase III delta prime subunit